MQEAEYFSEIIKELEKKEKYNLKNLIYAKYKQKYVRNFFPTEYGENRIYSTIHFYGILIKKENSYYDIINNNFVKDDEFEEMHHFEEDIELSLDEIRKALEILEEKFDLFIQEENVHGSYGGVIIPLKFRATQGTEEISREEPNCSMKK